MNPEIQIFEVLRDLKDEEFQTFKKLVSQQEGKITALSFLTASREDIVSYLMSSCGSRALPVVAQALHRLPARHLLEKLGMPSVEDVIQRQEISISSHTRREPPIGSAEPVVSQKTLMKLAKHVGHEWRELGILCLSLEVHQLDKLEEDNRTTTMRIFHMFQLWRNQEREKATATRLHQLLSHGNISISPEALAVLQEGT